MTTMIGFTQSPTAKKVKPKSLREVLEKVLQQLQRRDQYLFFAQPVSVVEVPNYHDFIKEPMDLGTMQSKLDQGAYTSLDAFKHDFLLITGNAQYFNSLNGPSAIVHTEAKKLEEWGLKALAKEAPAVEEALAIAAAEAAAQARQRQQQQQRESSQSNKPRTSGPRLSLKIRANSSLVSSGSATPRLSTPSGLQHEVKVEQGNHDTSLESAASDDETPGLSSYMSDEDEEDGDEDDEDEDEDEDETDDDDEDDDTDDDDMSSTNRADSMSIDGSGPSSSRKKGEGTVLKKKRRISGRRRKNGLLGRKSARNSSVITLLTLPTDPSSNVRRPTLARINTASGAVAAQIPLVYRRDGAIDLAALTEDEKIAILRPAGLDSWSDVTIPSMHSLVPLHPDVLPQAQSFERELKYTVDGFGAAVAQSSFPSSHTYSYDLDGRPSEQQKIPFNTSSGWAFGARDSSNVPVAWPRLVASTSNGNDNAERESGQAGVRAPRKDKERERDEEGLATLDDWSWPRAHLTRLQDSLDVGLYSGLLPAAWALHINSQKGGPSRSRLPPYHLASGSAFDLALLDELASLPHRALLGAKPGMIANTAMQPKASPADVTVAIQQAAERNWMPTKPELMRLGARGTDFIREIVYGGPLGEAYASSLEDFVLGASRSALENDSSDDDEEGEEDAVGVEKPSAGLAEEKEPVAQSNISLPNAPAAYFDEDGELFDQDAYIGVDLIPVEVRKEAGVAADARTNANASRESPSLLGNEAHRGVKRSRSTSVLTPSNKQRQSPADNADSPLDVKRESVAEATSTPAVTEAVGESQDVQAVLSCTLLDYVRDVVLTPITHGHLHILTEISKSICKSSETDTPPVEAVKTEPVADETPEQRRRRIEEELAQKTRNIISSLLEGEQHRVRSQTYELIRAQGNAVDVDRLVGGESDLISALKMEKEEKGMKEHGIPNPNGDLDEVLQQYAVVLGQLSDTARQGGVDEIVKRQAKIERLRYAFIAIAKRMSRLHVVNGQWTKWLDKAHKQQQQQRQQQRQQQPTQQR